MSIYCYIACNDCKREHHIMDLDHIETDPIPEPSVVMNFLIDHKGHNLEYYSDDGGDAKFLSYSDKESSEDE